MQEESVEQLIARHHFDRWMIRTLNNGRSAAISLNTEG